MNFEIKNGVLERYNGNTPDVIIPSCVTEIGKEAFKKEVFQDNKFLKSVIITGNVTVIGENAFEDCKNLEKIVIPESVTKIGNRAFSGCNSLKEIVIPKSVTEIWDSTFSDCNSLKEVVIPESVTKIGNRAFSGCNSLKEIVIPESVTKIWDSTFSGCNSLKEIVIPESVTKIWDSTFSGCNSLEEIVIPESVTTIGNGAFSGCNSLEKIVIPESVTEIGYSAFRNTKWLENKKATEKNVVVVNGIVISSADNIEESVNLEGIKEIHTDVFQNCNHIKEFIISDGIEIGNNAFLTGNDFNICLKHNDFYVNILVRKSEITYFSFNARTQSLFDFIGADMEHKEYLFDDLKIPEYRYLLAVFMANSYKSEFFRTFVDVHLEKIQEFAKNKAPYLLKFIGSKD